MRIRQDYVRGIKEFSEVGHQTGLKQMQREGFIVFHVSRILELVTHKQIILFRQIVTKGEIEIVSESTLGSDGWVGTK